VGLADLALAQARPADALPLARRALDVREAVPVPGHELAEVRVLLARALWDAPVEAGRDRAAAIVLAEQARDGLRRSGRHAATQLADVERWIAAHP
jgi:hypothetical protein